MNRYGTWVQNGTGELSYKSFKPSPLPPDPPLDIHAEMLRLLIQATRSLSELDAASKWIPDTELFLSMYVRKEALISSQIEGTQCTLDDVLDPDIDANANLDVTDVVNYVKATQFALDRRNELPLCNRLLREIHTVLLQGVRGEEKNPGEFRRSQNWIGAAGCALKDARFIPPNVEDMENAMTDLERYINEDKTYDPLIQAALIHYQFETIHPFLDGNGRIGRLLIMLYLMEQNLLEKPILYVSYFLKKNQVEYYDRMAEVRRSGNYEQWVCFFLEAVHAAAADAMTSIRRLSALHDQNTQMLPPTNRSKDSVRMLFAHVEQHPIIDIGHAAKAIGLSFNATSAAVKALVSLGILKETTNASRNRVFAYESYLQILREGT